MSLLLVFVTWLTGTLLVQFFFTRSIPLEEAGQMKEAREQAREWFRIIKTEKESRGIRSDSRSRVKNSFMLGDDFTLLTTTLGSLEAKEISTNPDFAALMVRLLHEAGCGEGDTAGLILSGSFPALAVSTLAALQQMKMEVVMLSSLGASSFGANQPGATWIHMENWLISKGEMPFCSFLLSPGAENDRGDGMLAEGRELILKSAEDNQRTLYIPSNLQESITYKTRIMEEEGIGVLINIGGNQSALGGCVHASTLPNGLHRELKVCRHKDRGLIQEISARNIPVIHLLNIKDLASEYGMDLAPGKEYAKSNYLYVKQEVNRGILAIVLFAGFMAFGIMLKSNKHQK